MLTVLSLSAKPGTLSNPAQQKPLRFIHNTGQVTDQHHNTRTDIDYKISLPGMAIFIGDAQLHYQWYKQADSTTANAYRMDVTLVGANIQAPVVATEQQEFYERYFNGNTGDEGLVAHTYNCITYTNVYPNIDWVLYTKGNDLKYDFVVRPGGNPALIKLRYDGATALAMNNSALTATTPYGSITEKAPYSYNAETKQPVRSAYKLTGSVLSFDVDGTDGTLVIDPQLLWGTYYGGSMVERITGNKSDKNGNIFISGFSSSLDNIATVGAYQTVNVAVSYAGIIAKFNANGKQAWGTYYGGSIADHLGDLCIDKDGFLYVVGGVYSADLASSNSYQESRNGVTDAILIKFNTAGGREWATYYGGSANDGAEAVACDRDGNVYISGETTSADNISTPGTHRSQYAAFSNNGDAFIAKFTAAGIRLWGTYFGGSSAEQLTGLGVDTNGNAYICGNVRKGVESIATAGAHQTTATKDSINGYFARFNGSDGTLAYCSYFGGNKAARIHGLTCAENGDFYLCGNTSSDTGIATVGAAVDTYSVNNKTLMGYLSKFNKDGVQQWGSYFGGDGLTEVYNVANGATGYFFASGSTTSDNGIATPNAHQTSRSGSDDAFLTGWTDDGKLIWGTYFGGQGYEHREAKCSYNISGQIILTGNTNSTNGIATSNAHQIAYKGGYQDGFIAAFSADIIINIHQPNGDVLYCIGDTFNLNYVVNQDLPAGNVFTAQLSDANRSFANPVAVGTLQSSTAGKIFCTIPLNTLPGTRYRLRIVSSSPVVESADNIVDLRIRNSLDGITAMATTPLCEFDTLRLDAKLDMEVPATYKWTGPNGYTANTQKAFYNGVSSLYNGKYVVVATEGNCSSTDTVDVLVRDKVTPVYVKLQADKEVREDTTITFTASVANAVAPQYRWQLNGSDIPGETKQTLTISNLQRGDKINVIVTVAQVPCLDANVVSSDTLITSPPGARKLLLYPNPNNGLFTILGTVRQDDGPLQIEVVNAMGVVLWTGTTMVADKLIRKTIDLTPLDLAPGAYILHLHTKGEVQDRYRHFSIVK